MSHQLPALIVVAPLIAALLIFMAGWVRRGLCFPLAAAALLMSLLIHRLIPSP